MTLTKRNGSYWAVEFTGDQVRLCCFRALGPRVVVEACETRPAEAFDFAGFCQEHKAHGSSEAVILCAVPRSEVLLKPFTLPRSGGVDLRKVTALKLEQSVSGLDPKSTLWGYMEDGAESAARHTHVLAAAISRGYVDTLMGRHFANGEHPALVECAALSAVRAHQSLSAERLRCELVVDCAPDGFSIFVLKEGVVDSAHLVPAGRPIEAVVAEIRRLILFLRGKRDGTPVEAVSCLGESAGPLAAALQEHVDLPVACGLVRPPQWIDNVQSLPEDWERDWHRVIGLIELVRSDDAAAINFLGEVGPGRAARAMLPALERFRTSLLAGALAVMLACAVFGQRMLSHRRETLKARIVNLAGKVTADLQRQEQARTTLNRYRSERLAMSHLFFELAELAPSGITLSTLTINPDGRVDVTGRCRRMAEADEFARKLNESSLFTAAETPSRRRERDRFVFKIAFKLTPASRRATP